MTDRLHQLSTVDDRDIAEVAERYQLGQVLQWSLCGQGLINTNVRIVSSNGDYLLRMYASDRTDDEVRFELSLLTHLQHAKFPAARPVGDRYGDLIGHVAGRPCAVLTFLPGHTVTQSQLSESLAHQVGARYAEFRKVVSGFTPDGSHENADHPAVSPMVDELLVELADTAPIPAEFIESAWRSVEPVFRPHPGQQLAVVHGDLFYENILVEDGRLTAFIDFDDAYVGLPLIDLALVVMEFATPPTELLDETLAAEVLRGFRAAGGENPAAGDLYNALLFLCCKFLCYTFPLTKNRNEPVTSNIYYRRLVDLSSATRRTALEEVFESSSHT